MKMVLDDAADLNMVAAYEPGRVKIRGQFHPTPLLIFPRQLDSTWSIATIAELDSKALRSIGGKKPELLIIGTGEKQHFPEPRVFIPLIDAAIGYEIMDNTAACRTYNILLSEGRNAAMLLLSDSPAP